MMGETSRITLISCIKLVCKMIEGFVVFFLTKLDVRPLCWGPSQTEVSLAWSGSSFPSRFILPIMKLSLVQARQTFIQPPENGEGELML